MASDSKPVRMCVCGQVTFKEIWDSGLRDLESAQLVFDCAKSCRLCEPYIKRMFETGETEFEVMD